MRASAIVSMDLRTVDLQPTIDYGRNNGRSPLLESNGLYYAVGNANNGNAAPKPLCCRLDSSSAESKANVHDIGETTSVVAQECEPPDRGACSLRHEADIAF
jgi:hypothetical protein